MAAGGSIRVSRSGRYTVLETDFGLSVSYDTDHSVEVKVPSTYSSRTCGMCGNFNGRRDDEYMKPDGQQAANSNELGESWKVEDGDPSCSIPPPTATPPPPCTAEQERLYQSAQYCGIMTSQVGAFVACHSVINPESFAESCVFDLCALNGSQQQLCGALEAYAAACQGAGVMLPRWRNTTFCPLPCPGNSHYNPYTSACPATCFDPMAPSNCSKPCVEGCECNTGFVLSGEQCVPIRDCGCLHQGKYYKKDETFWQTDCKGKCTCAENGTVTCSNETCEADRICKVQKGILGCYPPDTATCHIYGDPHYVTFDGRLYHFQGECNYTVVQPCDNSSEPFSVTTRNEHRGSPAWTALNSVSVTLKNVHVALRKNKEVQVNGIRVALPVNLPPGISVALQGAYVVVDTPVGIQVKFDGDHELFVRADERLRGQLCGLCGTYTENQLDDFLKPDHRLEQDSTKFGDSWQVKNDNWTCGPTPVPPACNPVQERKYEELCKIIVASSGPFVSCHWSTPPQQYFESCVYDLCATGGDMEQFCKVLGAYAAACELGGVSLGDWRKDTVCESCVAEGDPHYLTFDKQMHHFMGNCTYTLSKLCAPNSTLPNFNVEATNEYRGGYTHVSYVRDVAVDVYGHRITLEQGRVVTVDGKREILPLEPSTGLTVSSSGMYVVVTTDFGLRVRFDGNHRVEVTLPITFKGQVCGMCGNYNENPADDFLNPQGGMEPDSTSARSPTTAAVDKPPICNQTTQQLIGSSQFCGLLKEGTGPFKQCHGVLRPDAYFNNCAYDLCALQLEPGALCRSLQSYADACQSLGVTIDAWRNATFCPIQCPANSHYEPCMTACPATCARPLAPSTCGRPCLEGCVCDSGYLLYNDRCVPSGQCGCWHEDRHYPVGSEFWTDDTCSKKCRCPAAGSKPMCAVASCPRDYYCGVQNGIPGCYPHTYGICRVHNDPHYNTFDKATHHFMGTCTYTRAKVCGSNSTLPLFNVEAKNEHRGNPWVSYVQRVRVEVYGLRIDIVRNHRSRVLPLTGGSPTESFMPKAAVFPFVKGPETQYDRVNGEWTTLPVRTVGRSVQVSRSGRYTVLETDFGLSVSYDTDHSVEVKVPSTYSSRTCGMCGNFNGRRDDEYMKPDGQQAANSNELGESWKVEDGDPSCSIPPPTATPPPPCTAEQERLYQSAQYCGMMSSRPGAFTACHSVINPESFVESCVFDLCALNGSQQQLCGALEAYAAACQGAGVMLPAWRNATFCTPACPLNAHYESCATGCPATCVDRLAPQNCSKPCVEGCVCNTGFVLSGGDCVPEARCGCMWDGRYYSEGQIVVTEDCTRRCECLGSGQMNCSAFSCGPEEVCKLQDGQRGCFIPGPGSTTMPTPTDISTTLSTSIPPTISTTIWTSTPETATALPLTSSDSCVAEGDPHYLTFDKQLHHFMGNCTYTLSKLCAPNSTLPNFNVEATNEYRGGYTHVSYIRDVAVDVYSHRITLEQGRVVTPSTGLTVSSSGMYVVVTTDFGLRVRFDGNHRVEVTLPSSFKAQVCGMCGNYNGKPGDDFLNPQGGMELDSTSLGNSWQVSNHSSCPPAVDKPPICNQTTQQLIGSSQFCGLLKEGTGPFKQCHGVLRPDAYFNNCAYDLCALQLEPGALCRSLQSYADACQSLGVTIDAWRNATFCPIQCPANSHYEPCTTACPQTCARPTAPSTCSLPCVEGCVCDSGYLLYNDRCVPSGQCGCWHEDRHYPIGSEFWTDDTCSKKCRCPAAGSKLTCAVASCPPAHYCGLQNGVPGCYRYTYGVCRVHNDPHYNTFDKVTHHFMGTCTYTLAKVCGNDSALPVFNVEAKNEHRGNPWVSYVQRVRVEVYGLRIDIVRNHRNRVLVNGEWTTLPVRTVGRSVQVSRSGRYTVLETDFGLSVSYDTDHSVEVKVPSTYSSRTCGMCGNFNGRRDDEYMKPDGQQAANSNELGESWKVEDGDPSCSIPPPTAPPAPPCTAEQERLYQSAQYCGIMTSQVGAFVACHSVINPESFAESCVFDLCALNGSQQQLCGALEAYAAACQGAGVMLPRWRNTTFCPLPCPGNSHYNPYTSACPATCFDPMAPSNCSKPCVEGCECNTGFVLSGEQCVPIRDCGCLHQGKYYKKDETFWQTDCKGKCTCAENGTVTCSNETCEADRICKVQKGILGCYPPDTATCHIYGDPHYVTFDGRLYHFQGECNYTVVQPCDNSSEPFSVTTRNEHRGSPAWTALNSVSVTLKNVHVALRKNKEVQ
ncbi:IgGFc-binding protein-like, partial [Alligator sinensis]|uniref:IgGFc-binding protein-like n=1 Tax=Alligator sinensis TaxID=38654 RepID=A0A3Q0HAN7_ALLSI